MCISWARSAGDTLPAGARLFTTLAGRRLPKGESGTRRVASWLWDRGRSGSARRKATRSCDVLAYLKGPFLYQPTKEEGAGVAKLWLPSLHQGFVNVSGAKRVVALRRGGLFVGPIFGLPRGLGYEKIEAYNRG